VAANIANQNYQKYYTYERVCTLILNKKYYIHHRVRTFIVIMGEV
jgi:hypothetical protein